MFMAKKKNLPKAVKAKTPVGKAMALILPPKVQDILALEPLVRAGDVEGLHDIRVATKRLREATRLFMPAFGKRRMKARLEHLERLNDALGAARELDVMGLQLEDLAARNGHLAEGLQPLMDALATRRAAADEQLMPVLDETLPYLEQDFIELLKDRSKKRRDVWKMPFIELGGESVRERAHKAFALEPAAREPEAVAEFHRMRIAVKRVKYALELFLDVLGKPAKKAYKPISKLQELMGLVHDCDVLLEVLAEPPTDGLPEEVARQAAHVVAADRAVLHARTLDLLDKMHDRKLHEKLCRDGNDKRNRR